MLALHGLGITPTAYYASEIDKHAIAVSKANWPDIIHLGDIKTIDLTQLPQIDLLIGGSPCQDLSIAGRQKGLSGERSGLFYDYIRIKNAINPRFFMLENVANIPKDTLDEMNRLIGCPPITINSKDFSAQSRKRNYWTNIPQPVFQPMKSELVLQNILEDSGDWFAWDSKSKCVMASPATHPADYFDRRQRQAVFKPLKLGDADGVNGHDFIKRVYDKAGKSPTIVACSGGHTTPKVAIMQRGRGFNKGGIVALDGKCPTLTSSSWQNNNHLIKRTVTLADGSVWYWRPLTPVECERLQGMWDNYTNPPNLPKPMSKTQRHKMIGNGYQNETIMNLMGSLKEIYNNNGVRI